MQNREASKEQPKDKRTEKYLFYKRYKKRTALQAMGKSSGIKI